MGAKLASLLLLLAAAIPGCDRDRKLEIDADPVPLYAADPDTRDVGRLRYRAGFHLRAPAEEFGGFSGLVIDPAGRLIAVSDRGYWLAAELRHAPDGTLEGFGPGRLAPLLDDDGRPVDGRDRRDAEELLALPGEGFLVSFEGDHRLVLYPRDGVAGLRGRPVARPFPVEIGGLEPNSGMEALARLPDGRLVVFAEHQGIGGTVRGWVGDPGGSSWQDFTLRLEPGFVPTGAAALPTGDVLLLERRYSKEDGTRVRLGVLRAADLLSGVVLVPQELAYLEPPITLDNLEAVAVARGPRDETFVYLLSDDNLSPDQRTLLLQFELLP